MRSRKRKRVSSRNAYSHNKTFSCTKASSTQQDLASPTIDPLRIQLQHISPQTVKVVQVKDTTTIAALHAYVQIRMHWQPSCLCAALLLQRGAKEEPYNDNPQTVPLAPTAPSHTAVTQLRSANVAPLPPGVSSHPAATRLCSAPTIPTSNKDKNCTVM